MVSIESVSYGAFLALLSFVVCFLSAYLYFRKSAPSKGLKYSIITSAVYSLLTFVVVSIPSMGGGPEASPDLGPMLGYIMVALAAIINIPLHYLLKWYQEGYKGSNNEKAKSLIVILIFLVSLGVAPFVKASPFYFYSPNIDDGRSCDSYFWNSS